ncbi:MAG: phosphoenolpyruvate carboxykinase (GTP) [Desulfurococcaceae archaeon]
MASCHEALEKLMDAEQREKLRKIEDEEIKCWLAEVARLLEPDRIFIVTGSPKDLEYVRRRALENREELPTKNPLHTVHFDGIWDLARDRENTKVLVEGAPVPMVNSAPREGALAEVTGIMRGLMRGREMFVGIYCFGPEGSPLTMLGIQVTDSAYVVHSENILYRPCYHVLTGEARWRPRHVMKFVHATGPRNEWGWSSDVARRRIYIDLEGSTVYSSNTQYAGNTVGLKKLSLRLCVDKGAREGFLCEHMFIVGVRGPGNRVTYMTGAFPAGCGKTSTAFVADTLVSDDLAIVGEFGGIARAINPEVGSFGIIDGVNPQDDPIIYKILTDPSTEVIFANILLQDDGTPWWRGRPEEPVEGINYAGRWRPGMVDEKGREILPSHPNGRFTVSLRYLPNLDPRIDDPAGVEVEAMIFGGRDSNTRVPVEEAYDWVHGMTTMAAALESEKTAATLGEVGKMEFNPFAMLDFLSISPGLYLKLHLDFAKRLDKEIKVFNVNYFLRDEQGRFLNEKLDKRVWLRWMELRVHGDVEALETPTGLIPIYEDLRELFRRELGKEYGEADYEKQFALRTRNHLAKVERIWKIYAEKVPDAPKELFEELAKQRRRLEEALHKYGDVVSPFKFDRA